MTNPRDDLMALAPCPFCGGEATVVEIKPHSHSGGIAEFMPDHPGSAYIDCACGVGIIDASKDDVIKRWNTRAASRPATQVVDREAVARALCESGKFETGEGTCSLLCMDQLGSVRKKGCNHLTRVHGKLADAILSLLRPAKAWDSATSPGMTDLMVSPESLDAVGEPGENVQSDVVAQRTWFDGENGRTENLTADDIYQKPDATSDAVVEPVAWRLRTTNGSSHNYCHVVTDGELEIWKHNWASHLAQGTAVLEPLYTHPPAQPDINAAVLQERERCAAWHDTMVARWQQHYDNWKRRDNDEGMGRCEMHMNIHSHAAAAIRLLPTPERSDK